MTTHSHPGSFANFARGWRLTMAELLGDDDTKAIVYAELGDCIECWRETVAEVVEHRAMLMLTSFHGATNATVDSIVGLLAGNLDAIARDEKRWAL